jgi:hypothetical protein
LNDKTHCKKCCLTIDKNLKHCCRCKSTYNLDDEDCKCFKYQNIVDTFETIFSNGLKSKCLEFNCKSVELFENMIDSLQLNNSNDFYTNSNNWIFVYHGTPTLFGSQNICCDSWDTSMRGANGQAYGPGEYFTSSKTTAHTYAKSNGVIIISIIPNIKKFNIKEIKIVEKPGNEKWYVVNNTDKLSFALPIAIININNIKNINFECPKQHIRTIHKITDVMYSDNHHNFVSYDENTKRIVIDNFNKNNFIFDILINSTTYNINLKTMSQTNLTTNYKRNIMIK